MYISFNGTPQFGWVQLVAGAVSALGSAYGKSKGKKDAAAAGQMEMLAMKKEQKIAEAKAKVEAAKAGKILGLPKNIFYPVAGLGVIGIGVGVYFMTRK